MSAFCALFDPTEAGDGGALRRMTAASRHSGLRTATVAGTAGFALASPLWASSEGVWVAVDARLDDREELRISLSPWLSGLSGTPSDAELILAAYRRWGARCPMHLLGDFAFVVWDKRLRKVFAARDPLGVKQLHHARAGHLLCFASEAGCLLGHPSIPSDLDLVTVADFLAALEPEGDRTFFRNIRKLLPGHCLTGGAEDTRITRFWDPPEQTLSNFGDDEAARHLCEILQRAVGDRMRGEGTVAVALSGGLDSGSVAALARRERERARSPERLLAASLVFDRLTACDERSYIQATVESARMEPLTVPAEQFWFLADPAVADAPHVETPALSWEGGFQEMLRLLREQGVSVVLTGHGADDLLRGSSRIYAERLRAGDLGSVADVLRYAKASGRGWRAPYRLLAEPLLPPGCGPLLRRLARRAPRSPLPPEWIRPELARATGLTERLRTTAVRARGSARQEIRASLVDRPGYGRSVEWYERNAAPFGIEVRHPFLDRRLFEFVLALPPRQLFRLGEHKPLLRRAMAGLVPDLVRLRRTKTRLGSFVDYSLREKAVVQVEKLLAAPVAADLGILDPDRLRSAYSEYRNGTPDESKRLLWYALTLESWLRRHVDSARDVPGESGEAA